MKTCSVFLLGAILAFSNLTVGASVRATTHLPRNDVGTDGLDSISAAALPEGSASKLIERAQPSTTASSTSSTATSTAVAQPCVSALAGITAISNEAGLAACYNILQHDVSQGTFDADLRLYQMRQPGGEFSGLTTSQMLIDLIFPATTTFTALKNNQKRSLVALRAASGNTSISEVQQYTLLGTFLKTVDASKLNQTELMSLMLPSINVIAAKPNATNAQISTHITMTDVAFFVVGDFENEFTPSLTTAALQKEAIAQSTHFILPGTSLGIFPTGLIVTCSWTFLFLAIYGLGTVGRFRHRSFYRKRVKAMRGRIGFRV